MNSMMQSQDFAHFNGVLKSLVEGLAQMLNEQNIVSVDFEDVRTIISQPGKAAVGMAVASGIDRARIAADQAVASFLFEGVNLLDAKGLLVLIIATKEALKLSECKLTMNTVRAFVGPDTHILFSAVYDETLGEGLRVMVVATGLEA